MVAVGLLKKEDAETFLRLLFWEAVCCEVPDMFFKLLYTVYEKVHTFKYKYACLLWRTLLNVAGHPCLQVYTVRQIVS